MNISDCCKADVKVEGDDKEGTYYYVCTKCNKPCDYLNEKELKELENFRNAIKYVNQINLTKYIKNVLNEGDKLNATENKKQN